LSEELKLCHALFGSVSIDQFSTIGSACFTLIIALITFFSLAHPLSTITANLEHRLTFPIIAIVVFLISFVPALPLTLIYDLVDVRGVCWFVPNTNASNLVIFVPRAFVLVCVIILYTRLLVFFQKRDMKLFGTNSMSQTGEVSDEAEEGEQTRSKRFSVVLPRRMSNWTRRSSNVSNARNSDATMVKGPPVSLQQGPPTTTILLDTTSPHSTPSYSPHALAPIPASPGPADVASFTNPFPGPYPDNSTSTGKSSPDLENFLPSSVNDSRRPSDQPSALSHFKIDETSSAHDRQARPRIKRRRGPLSPRQINRRLSVLLMLYPLAYALLIAVSLARLIKQLATHSAPSPALSNISRWLIYSQGLIDGLLFTVIRWVLFNFGRSRT